MKGDFTRIPSRRSRRYSGVRLQQGRVQLDADFNEQVEIDTRRDRLTARDVIGPVGAPEEGGGFAIFPAVRLDAIALSDSGGAIAGERGSVLTTSDGGQTWTAANAPLAAPDLHGIAIPAAGKLVAVGDGAVWRRDGSWSAATVPSGFTAKLRAVAFADTSKGWAVGDGAAIMRTTDGGANWTAQAAPAGVGEDLHAVHFASATKGWAVGKSGRIIATTDGGTTWVARPGPEGFDSDLHAVRFADANNGLAVGAGAAILATADGGATWTLREAPPGVGATLRALTLRTGGHAWAAGQGATMIASHDGGTNWVELDLGAAGGAADLRAVAATAGDVVAAGERSTVVFGGEAAWQRATVPGAARDLAISAGRIYVDGTLVEAEEGARVLDQPFVTLADPPGDADDAGRYLVYLDVWQRHLTAVEEPALREVALGGPDTATRTTTVWHAKLLEVDAECRDFGAEWTAQGAATGRMRAEAEPDEVTDDECAVPATGGYRRLENQLYRVEVHQGSDEASPSFLWSRDNGSVLTRLVAEIEPDPESGLPVLSVAETGRDAVGGFFGAKYVELSDEQHVLANEPGTLLEVERVDERRIVLQDPGFDVAADWGPGALVRRWDGTDTLVANGWRTLEDGVRVQFGAGDYVTGDYWTVPARTATAEVEWPRVDGAPQFEPRHGTAHAQAPLALVDLAADGTWTLRDDCRPLFTPLALHTRLSMAGGDGQELDPSAASRKLPYPLEVSVMNGCRPVEDARVRFAVLEGGGSLAAIVGAGAGASAVAETDQHGLAGVEWTLSASAQRHRVRAQLLDRLDNPLDAPVHFNARIAAAGREEEPGIHVEEVRAAGRERLRNDDELAVELLAKGLDVVLDERVEPLTIRGKPTCFVTLDFPFGDPDQRIPTHAVVSGPIGTIPLTLGAEVVAEGNLIHWRPAPTTTKWIASSLRERLQRTGEMLVHLTLKGNFVYAEERPELNVDGEAFGALDGDLLDVKLPTGDRRRGGDLEMWFRLFARGEPEPEPGLKAVLVLPYLKSQMLADVGRRWRPFAEVLDLGLERDRLREVLPEQYAVATDATFDPAGARELFTRAELRGLYRAVSEPDLGDLGDRIRDLLQSEDMLIEFETEPADDPVEEVQRMIDGGQRLDLVIATEETADRLGEEMSDLFDPGLAMPL
jgi:photosystem II stability/assembly factor-like uncharacterized protein